MGMDLNTDFGHPSLLNGLWAGLNECFDGVELTHYQFSDVSDELKDSFEFTLVGLPISYKELLLEYIKWKTVFNCREDAHDFFVTIKNADIVVDPFGIRFCDKFCKGKSDFYNMIRYYCSEYMPFLIAHNMGKSIFKMAASYGNIGNLATKKSAIYMCDKIYTEVISREQESKRQLTEIAGIKKNIPVSPDMANLIKVKTTKEKNLVGVSVSFQIERQFSNPVDYVNFMVSFCKSIIAKYGVNVVLIPNQTLLDGLRDDFDIANQIYESMTEQHFNVSVLEKNNLNAEKIKKVISSCEVLVGSRYHSCVAALSSGVPVLVLGWHHKYTELLDIYGQSGDIIDVKNFDLQMFIKKFDYVWANKEEKAKIIEDNIPKVSKRVIDIMRSLLKP